MAAASSGLSKRFDVFLSFWGKDTRRKFTSHLHSAFIQKGIVTFMDTAIDRGEEITPAILKAIEESSVSVIIFSENYASSPWCLDELVKIIECMKTQGRRVLPVFYKVDPADIEKQTGTFGVAFAEYEESFKDNMHKVQTWRTTLTEAAYLSGWDSRNTNSDSDLIEEVVKDVLRIIRHLPSYNFEDLVGIDSQIEQIESLLCIGVEDVRLIGIWGMGGIGKTSLAKVVFQKFAHLFEGACFLENIREASSTRQGLASKCDELVKHLLNIEVPNANSYLMSNRLRYKKVFVVVDDVDNFEQLELLVGKHCWFGAGSRIIITSRDKQVLQCKADYIYEVQLLPPQESLQLFCLFAFKADQPHSGYVELSNRVVSYVKGIPLALKVLGSFLYGKNESEWVSALDKLEKLSNLQIQKVLMISYEGLDHNERKIFLDIACFFKGWSLRIVTEIFDACGYSPLISLRVLSDKALITMRNSIVEMHDLLQEMGRQIVLSKSDNDPSKQRWLWAPEDISYVLTDSGGTEAIEGMFLDQSKIAECRIESDAFYRTKRLKWLSFCNNNHGKMQFPQGLNFLPNQLRILRWNFFPLKSLPSNFQAENLVILNMSYSHVEQLWAGVQNLANLASLKLQHCRHLVEMPDLSRAQNLFFIDCRGCTNLQTVSPSIKYLKKLEQLHLQYCEKIKCVPSTKASKNFTVLNITGCSNLDEFPEVSTNIQTLLWAGTPLGKSSESRKFLSGLGKQLNQVCQSNISLNHSREGNHIYFSEISLCLLNLSSPKKMNDSIKYLNTPASVPEHNIPGEPNSDIPEKFPSSTVIPTEMLQYEQILAPGAVEYKSTCNHLGLFNLASMGPKKMENAAMNLLKRVQFLACAGLVLSEKFFSIQPTDDYECAGSSVTVQLPPNWFTSNFFAFNVVAFLGFKDENQREIDDFLRIRWKCQFETESGETSVVSMLYQYFPPKYCEDFDSLMYLELSNSCAMLSESWLSSHCIKGAIFEANIEHSSARPCYVVKKVWARLVYLGDKDGNPPLYKPCCSDYAVINHEKDSNINRETANADAVNGSIVDHNSSGSKPMQIYVRKRKRKCDLAF